MHLLQSRTVAGQAQVQVHVPKMLIKIALTCLSEVRMFMASNTCRQPRHRVYVLLPPKHAHHGHTQHGKFAAERIAMFSR